MDKGSGMFRNEEDGTVTFELDDDAARLLDEAARQKGIPSEGMIILTLMKVIEEQEGRSTLKTGRACDLLGELADELEKTVPEAANIAEAIRYYAQFTLTAEVSAFGQSRPAADEEATTPAEPDATVG